MRVQICEYLVDILLAGWILGDKIVQSPIVYREIIKENHLMYCDNCGSLIKEGPFALMLGASNSEDIFLTGLLVCIGSFLLVDMAIITNSKEKKLASAVS